MESRSIIEFLNKRAAVLALFVADTSNGLSNAPGVDVTVQGLYNAFLALACYATGIVMILMVIMIVWYGYKMMSSGGNDAAFQGARKSLNHAVIGVLVIFAANTIIATVGNAVSQLGNDNPDFTQRSSQFIDYTILGGCSL
jgi:hypothetical protein